MGAGAGARRLRACALTTVSALGLAEVATGGGSLMSLEQYTNAITTFVVDHREWAAPIVFVLAFGESLAFVSLILPFWGMLVVIGTIIGASESLSFWTILAAAAVGAAFGDWLSYWLGYHYHEQVQGMWPLKNHPSLIENGVKFFRSWGGWAIVFGRFSGPLRASVPIAAGIAQMPQLIFQIANFTSAFLWAFVLLSPGTFGMKLWLHHFS
jgi:membrane protein DedA with SNARE-associated domain